MPSAPFPPLGRSGQAVRQAIILLVDAKDERRAAIRAAATGVGYVLREATFDQLDACCRSVHPIAILLGCDSSTCRAALAAAAAARAFDPELVAMLIVEDGSETTAVAALRAGVNDYLRYPLDATDLAASLARCVGARESASDDHAGSRVLIGSSPAMQRVQQYLAQVAQGDANVLITGETGTGKELAAAYVHDHSDRRRRRFVPVNCAAIPDTLLESELFGYEKGAFTGASASRPGLLETADGGTVFFDEVGEMGLAAQAKILRAIESREVYRVGGRGRVPLDIRIVAATNQDLEQAVDEGRFRKDLYFRLHVASVRMPALRERPGDIRELVDHYLRDLNERARRKVSVSEDVREALGAYEWPGNVRELKNLVESLFVCPPSGPVELTDLPEMFYRRLGRFCATGNSERRALLTALFDARWNKSRAAEILECSRMTLYRRMAKYSVVRSTPPANRARKS